MAKVELKLPQMGESVAEATITSWLKGIGETIEADEAVLEIATDKVDSEIPSEVDGILIEQFFEVDQVAKVGDVLAIIETTKETTTSKDIEQGTDKNNENNVPVAAVSLTNEIAAIKETHAAESINSGVEERFYSPLVKNIAAKEEIAIEELDTIKGTGKNNRVTKNDILKYIADRKLDTNTKDTKDNEIATITDTPSYDALGSTGADEIIEMTRMGKLISQHMSHSLQTAAHVQSFIEADVTNLWNWRNKVKKTFQERENEKLTFTPIFLKIVAKTIKEFPLINSTVAGDKIIKKKNINLGMAAALPDGNLIVPVIKNADLLNLTGMAKQVNDLAARARGNQLKPDEIQGGTYTVTNVGNFGSIMGTPIINQPQVAILALGAIRKVPAVIETPDGDFIGIRYKMFLSHSYDHRIINGALGGQFIKRVTQYIEAWDPNAAI